MSYLRGKILFYLLAAWAALTANFAIPRLIPGNPVDAIMARLQGSQPMPPAARQALDIQFGVTHQPLYVQYLKYLDNLAHGNLGLSVTHYPTPVITVLVQALPWTLVLVGMATLISCTLGVGLGALAGARRGSWLDNLIPAGTFLASIPYFWLALILLYFLSEVLKIFPLSGGYSYDIEIGFNAPFLASAAYHAVLPAVTIVVSSIAGWTLGMRNMMVSSMADDYVLTAQAKGLKQYRIMMSYGARNAVLPSVAGFATSLGFVVSGSIITETVFSYPGIGFTLLQAVQNSDYSLMQGIFLVISFTILGANFLVDLLYAVIDPRTRQAS